MTRWISEAQYDAQQERVRRARQGPVGIEACAAVARLFAPERRDPMAANAADTYPLVALCRAAGFSEPVPEYQFHPGRRWRFDYAWPLVRIAVEIEGGIWTQGRHVRGAGFLADMEKYNAAAVLGWRVLRYPPDRIADAVADVRAAA